VLKFLLVVALFALATYLTIRVIQRRGILPPPHRSAPRAQRRIVAPDDDEDFLRQVDTKALGYARVVRAAAPYLERDGGGRVVNISGMNARLTGSITGSVRNIAVVAITKNLADELGPRGISVTCVHPGLTVTERVAAARVDRSL